MTMIIRGLYFLGLCLILPVWAFAATPKFDSDVETRILSNEMTYFASGQKVRFSGAVHIIRPDFELWADTLTVYLEKNAKPASKSTTDALPTGMDAGDVERIVAENNVRMKRGTSIGNANKINYVTKTGIFTMEGNPSLNDKGSIITGHIIKYYTNENRSEVLGAPGKQVQVVFPSSKKKSTVKRSKKSALGQGEQQ